MALILGIETTCDETAIALVRDGHEILGNLISSQVDLHKKYGGVIPELAAREHIKAFPLLLEELKATCGISWEQIDAIAVAHGPGLLGALLIGITSAKALSLAWKKPLIGVNHIEAHLYASLMPTIEKQGSAQKVLPALGVIISGGHTMLVEIEEIGTYRILGETVDDAIGEAFDKVASLIGLPYPGGPAVEKLALTGDPKKFPFKPGVVKGEPYQFSFSGLKTNFLYTQQKLKSSELLDQTARADLAASFQRAAFSDLVKKIRLAMGDQPHKYHSLIFGGGVSQNRELRRIIEENFPDFTALYPPPGLSLDNGAMIAGLGEQLWQQRIRIQGIDFEAGDVLHLLPFPRLPLCSWK